MGYDAERAEDDWYAMSPAQQRAALRDIEQYEREQGAVSSDGEYGVTTEQFMRSPTAAFRRIAEQITAAYIPQGAFTVRTSHNGNSPIEEVEKNVSRKDAILQRMKQLEAEMAELAKLPDEPTVSDSPFPPVIFFVKEFPGSDQEYSYVFYKAPHNGRWYGTGARQMRVSYTWDELMEWLKGSGPMPVIYKLTGYEEYFAPEESE